MPPPVLMNFVDVSVDMCENQVPEWALKSKLTNYRDHGHHGDFPRPGKIPMVEPGNFFFLI
jgi:hypothetical protein